MPFPFLGEGEQHLGWLQQEAVHMHHPERAMAWSRPARSYACFMAPEQRWGAPELLDGVILESQGCLQLKSRMEGRRGCLGARSTLEPRCRQYALQPQPSALQL